MNICGPIRVNLSDLLTSASLGTWKVEGAVTNRPVNQTKGLQPDAHASLLTIGDQSVEINGGPYSGYRAHEILDHAVRSGVIDIDPAEFSITDDVDARLFLFVRHDLDCIDRCLFGWRRNDPIRNCVAANHHRFDF